MCHDSIVDLDRIRWAFVKIVCVIQLASVKEEEIFVNTHIVYNISFLFS